MASMMTLLKSNADSSYQQLHPAAVRSLANGAALLEACSNESLLSISDVEHLITNYQASMIKNKYDSPRRVRSLGVALKPLVDAFVHRYLMKRTAISDASVSYSTDVYLRQALGHSTDNGEQEVSGLVQLYWIWCTEVTTNPAQYGLDPSSPELTRLKAWSSRYLSESDPVRNQETPAFLSAINRLYGSVALSDTNLLCLQPSVYVIVVFAAIWPQSDEQRVTGMDLLSKCSFPSLKAELIRPLGRLARLEAQQRPHSTTEPQKTLENLLESQAELEIKSKGIDKVKEELESQIIAYYQADCLDTYSARVIECIHEARGIPPDDKLASLIEQKLKDVPPCHRGLKQFSHSPEATLVPFDPALIVPSPLSRSVSLFSVSGERGRLQDGEEGCDVDHVSISITP
ncbi:hypothetical protein RHS04_00426 [Rhizoctonia solani]|uniref:Uncharacterized protein n=1 Tax=Rhizoctonia solani TaxID=456999 RepID=A0A8H7LP39_9AGAM|nr:hypothetical protein RHS04_00426 [Rhizoctonia solani]